MIRSDEEKDEEYISERNVYPLIVDSFLYTTELHNIDSVFRAFFSKCNVKEYITKCNKELLSDQFEYSQKYFRYEYDQPQQGYNNMNVNRYYGTIELALYNRIPTLSIILNNNYLPYPIIPIVNEIRPYRNGVSSRWQRLCFRFGLGEQYLKQVPVILCFHKEQTRSEPTIFCRNNEIRFVSYKDDLSLRVSISLISGLPDNDYLYCS